MKNKTLAILKELDKVASLRYQELFLFHRAWEPNCSQPYLEAQRLKELSILIKDLSYILQDELIKL